MLGVSTVKFSLHGGSDKDEAVLRGFAERLGAKFAAYKGLPEEEPLLVFQCFPKRSGLINGIEQLTRWLDGDPLPEVPGGLAQDPLPGLETVSYTNLTLPTKA